jgi:hypothetical protein
MVDKGTDELSAASASVDTHDSPEGVALMLGMVGFRTIEYSYKEPSEDLDEKAVGETAISFIAAPGEGTIDVELLLEFGRKADSVNDLPALRIKTNTRFRIGGFESLMSPEGVMVPTGLIRRAVDVAFDTTRGMMISKSVDTIFKGYLTPMLPSDFIKPSHTAVAKNGESVGFVHIPINDSVISTEEVMAKGREEIQGKTD